MVEAYRNSYLQFLERSYDRDRRSEHLIHDNPRHQRVARPLFKAGVSIASISARMGFHHDKRTSEPLTAHTLALHLQGKLSVTLGSETHELHPGDLAYCPPGVPFAWFGEEDDLSVWIYFRIFDTEFWQPLKQQGPYVRSYDSTDLVFILLRRVLDADPILAPDCVPIALGDAMSLAHLISRLRYPGPSGKGPYAHQLRELVDRIYQSPAEKWTSKRMADRLNVCPRTLLRICQQEFNQPPRDMVVKIRMKCAIGLLSRTTDKLSVVAQKVGYESVYSFSRLFRKHIGMSPGRYRTMKAQAEQVD